MNLKILHLLSNWKWTEISEPAVELALAQNKLGAEIEFVCGRDPIRGSKFGIEYHARSKGLDAIHVLDMPKHLNVLSAFNDFFALRPRLKRFNPDVIHCHKSNALMMGLLIRGMSKLPVIVYNSYDPEGPPQDKRSRLLYRIGTDGVVVINEKSRQRAILVNGFSSENVQVAEPGIDLERFSPRRKLSEKIGSFGLKKDDFVIGVVTRIRESRRLDIVLKALHALAPAHPQIQILLVGRGRKGAVESAVGKPAREMDIFDRIVMTGYCEGDRLVAAYRAMDVLVYSTPGSDKSCRTVREAMAAGTPVIAPGIGFLPELIEDNLSGRLMDFRWESLVKILKELIRDKIKLHEMGRRSLETAIQRFSPNIQAEKTLAFYHKLLKII
jgi:glycosyltransferase involved in cell wall biosynthesis